MIDGQSIQSAVTTILEAVGENPAREGLKDTPRRVASMYAELFSGIGVDPRSALNTIFEEEEPNDGVVILREVPFFSMCEHHLLPFFGRAHMGYIPNGRIVGASKLVRALDVVARKLQLQERMTSQLSDAILDVLTPDGVGVVIEAEHLCMAMRGVSKEGSLIVTSATRGSFDKRGIARGEFLDMLHRRIG